MKDLRIEIDDKSGFCFGVVRAISEAEKALAGGETVYSLGDIVHNRIEVQRLEKLGPVSYTHLDVYKRQELGCTGGPYVITSQPGVRRDILCAGNPAVFDFVEKVLEEVIGLFPSKYIHIGGDESPRTRWRECPECQSLIRRAGLTADTHHSAEDKLQGYFNTRIEEFLARHGRRLIGWDEIVDGGMSPDATVMSWRGTAGGIRAADEGFDVIMSPNSSLYFDYYQSANIDTEPPTIGGYIPLKKVYDTEPVPEELTRCV